jgi:hypothetical protein
MPNSLRFILIVFHGNRVLAYKVIKTLLLFNFYVLLVVLLLSYVTQVVEKEDGDQGDTGYLKHVLHLILEDQEVLLREQEYH